MNAKPALSRRLIILVLNAVGRYPCRSDRLRSARRDLLFSGALDVDRCLSCNADRG